MKLPIRGGTTNELVGVIWFVLLCGFVAVGLVGAYRVAAQFFGRATPMDWSGFWLLFLAWVGWEVLHRFVEWYRPRTGENDE